MSAITAALDSAFSLLLEEGGEDVVYTSVLGQTYPQCLAIRVDDEEFFSPGMGEIQHYSITYEFLRTDIPEPTSNAIIEDVTRGGTYRVEGELERTEVSIKVSVSQVAA